jgi:hypothetical protein
MTFAKGDLIASMQAEHIPISKAVISVDKLLPQLSRDDLEDLFDRLTFDLLADPTTTPEERRELLARFDHCPCCKQWLGHNRQPDDDPSMRRQTAFDFKRE